MDGDTAGACFLFIAFWHAVISKPCKMITYTALSSFVSKVSRHNTVFYKSANTGDVGLLPYAVMALSACTGVTVLRLRRKRED